MLLQRSSITPSITKKVYILGLTIKAKILMSRLNDIYREKTVLLKSVLLTEELTERKASLLPTFFLYLQNQLSSIHSIFTYLAVQIF